MASALQTVLGPVAARATGVVRRTSKLTGARCVQTLVFGWLAQAAARRGVAISAQRVAARFGAASADCRREVVEEAVPVVLAADPVAVPVLRRFTAVTVQDCTTIRLADALATAWPGCGSTPASGQAAVKLGMRLDLVSGHLVGPSVAAGRTNDRSTSVAGLPVPPGALRLADLGCFSVAEAERSLRHLVTSRKISGGTRMTLASFVTWRAEGRNPFLACRHLLTYPTLTGAAP